MFEMGDLRVAHFREFFAEWEYCGEGPGVVSSRYNRSP
jgi:hypothetical protein